MLYKPKYCCNCGEEIERVEWRIWHSRRFCMLCETEFKPHDLVPRAIFMIAILFGITGLGTYFSAKPNTDLRPEPAAIRSLKNVNDKIPQSVAIKDPAINEPSAPPVNDENAEANEPSFQVESKPLPQKKAEVFLCGATTKKGTSCTRKVKQKGFCWQHKDSAEAITPPRPKAEF